MTPGAELCWIDGALTLSLLDQPAELAEILASVAARIAGTPSAVR